MARGSNAAEQRDAGAASVAWARPTPDVLVVRLAGSWRLTHGLPPAEGLLQALDAAPEVRRLAFEGDAVADWDSSLLAFLTRIVDRGRARDLAVDPAGLPAGVAGLLRLAYAVPERAGARRGATRASLLARVGIWATGAAASAREAVDFIGQVAIAFGNLLRGRARFRRSDLALVVQECGAQALPIVTLISFLVGWILAFVGAVQLRQFGAQIFVANLVGLGMALEMGAMMSGIIMAGRTGAAFAAQLGTMTVNEEIDALATMGIPPIEFLVLPRMLALMLMMPLLCLYADLMGILGGAVVGIGMLDIGPMQYFHQTQGALGPVHFALGLVKSAVYGAIVAIAGCLRGMQCGRSAAAVGQATTSAVVTGIVLIVVASGVLTVVYDVLGLP